MFNLFEKSKKAFGLEVSSSTIKAMQLENKKGNLSVRGYASADLPKGLIVNDSVSDAKTLSFLVKKMLEKPDMGRVDAEYCVVSLPESKSFVRVIQIPIMGEAEADSAVPFEAESFIPMPIDQVYLDWQKISETGDKMNVLIIASPKEFVDKHLSVLDQCGLKPIALEVESQSCQRALIATNSEETVLIIDMQASRSSMVLVEDGSMQFTSTIPIAGNSFSESIAKALGVSSAKAEEVKKKVGIANVSEYPNIKTFVVPVLNTLSSEIKNILKFHSDHSEKPVSKIILTGGSAKLKNLPEFLTAQLADLPSMKIELANPWINLPKLKNLPLNPYDALGYTTAIGLAMRGVKS